MRHDAFSHCHPLVNFLFFLCAIGLGVVIQHPAYLLAGVICAAAYYLLLRGAKGWGYLLALMPMFLILTLINPLFNTLGTTVLLRIFGRPYTLEALINGAAIACVFLVMMIWFGCYNVVMSSDKFTSLFGNLIPALSLLLVMVLRMIPNFIRKTSQISLARKSIGKGTGSTSNEKIRDGLTVISALTDWALEGGVVTGDSMRARGYGCGKRSSFQIYTMKPRDWLILAAMSLFCIIVILAAAMGAVEAAFTPQLQIASVSGFSALGLISYCFLLLIPSVLHIKEAMQWHISRSKI